MSIITFIDIRTMREALQAQTNQALLNSASMMASRVDEFIKTNRASIATEAEMPVYSNFLSVELWERNGSQQARELQIALESLQAALKVKERTYLVSFALLDHLGNVVYSSVPGEIGQSEREAVYFVEPVRTGRSFDSNIEFSPDDNQPYIYFSQIIKNDKQKIVGVLRARFDAMILQSYAKEFTGALGEDSYPILVDEHMIRVAEPASPVLQWKAITPLSVAQEKQLQAANRLPAHDASTTMSAPNLELAEKLKTVDQAPFFSVVMEDDSIPDSVAVAKLTSRPWLAVFSQSENIAMAAINRQRERAILINTLVAGIVAVLSTLMARVLSNQIQSLTNTADEISRGNLQAKAMVVAEDELGTLGRAFNFMTEQILNLINGLEDRVQARTHELARQNETLRFRARQFETVADVARGVTSTRNLEELLDSVTRLISDRFEFYHVGIFLLDDAREYAVLRAANSEGGQRMLARKHQLLVGHIGMVGYAAASGEARIATDVGQDAVFFNNPDLPLTRSEMALPLKANDEIIGVLDVQSTVSNAFSQDDIQLFGILADQIAIAIYNNRLYSETAQALDEAQRVHQRYLHQAWQHELENYQHDSYRF
ncbi:MAG TPA: GAF domain-containing protein, partial [Anaerolineaceae bacterium]|nr:GAF domain-containing protein [Anaerolineaceae bacterium]